MFCALAGMGTVAALPAFAAPADYFDLGPEQLLNAEVISVSKKPEKVSQAPAAVYVITQEDIQRSGVTTVADALRMAPGVDVAQVNSNSWAISIRGFNATLSNKILVMVDGRTVYNPLFAGTYWDIQDLMLEDIARIEVVRGPGGALWGANAVDGVINIISKSSADTQGNLVVAGGGNHERDFAEARHGGTEGAVTYRTYAKYFDRASFETSTDHNAEDDWRSFRAGFRADAGDRLTVQGDVYNVLSGAENTSYFLTPPYSNTSPETIHSQGANILGRYKMDYSDGSLLTLQSYLDYTLRDQFILRDSQIIADADAQYNFAPMGRHAVVVGGGYRLTADDLKGSSEVSFDPSSSQQNLFSLFIQDKITLDPKWSLTVGSKFEHNDFTGFETQPNARVEFIPNASQTFWSSVSRAVRVPSRLERDLNLTNIVLPPGNGLGGGLPTFVQLEENKNFDSEKLTAYELGYRQQFTPNVSTDLATFFNHYDQLSTLGFMPTSVIPNGGSPYLLFPIDATNGMTGEAYGAELAATWNVNQNWKLVGTYTYLNMTLHVADNHGFNLEAAESRSPQNQAGLRSNWNISDRWTFDTSAYYVGALKNYHVDPYIRLDTNLGWKIDDNIRLNLIGQNLLPSAQQQEFLAPAAVGSAKIGRSVFGKLTWGF